jgi:hypothetical protein
VALDTAPSEVDCVDANNLIAHSHTSTAKYAVLMVTDEKGIVVLIQGAGGFKGETGFGYIEFVGISLELACTAFFARHAVKRVFRDENIDDVSTHLVQLLALRFNLHTFRTFSTAAGNGIVEPFYLDDAQPAAARNTKVRMVAEARNIDAMRSSCFHHS